MRNATITRDIARDPATLFATWTDPQAMRHFWTADPAWPVRNVEVEARAGGRFRVEFGPPGETPLVEEGAFEVFEPPHRIVYQEHVLRNGQTLHGPTPCTVTFSATGPSPAGASATGAASSRVVVVSTLGPGESVAERAAGWANQLDLFVEYVLDQC